MKSNTTNVAQAISFAIDEVQEFGTATGTESGLYLDRTEDRDAEGDLRITEVSAELENAPNGLQSQFTVTTSDGQVWNVRVTPAPAAPSYPDARLADPTQDFSKFDAHGNPR